MLNERQKARELPTSIYIIAAWLCGGWVFLILGRDTAAVGCQEAPALIYDDLLHTVAIVAYVVAHVGAIWQVSICNSPFIGFTSRLGRVTLVLRRLKLALIVRGGIVTTWLLLFFYLDTDDTDVPLAIIEIHFCLQFIFYFAVVLAVHADNEHFSDTNRINLNRSFYMWALLEIAVGTWWCAVNAIDVHKCHSNSMHHSYLLYGRKFA